MDIKDQIMAVGLRRFNAQGIGPTTVRHITQEVGIGLGHFNYYFRKKEDLVHALYLRWIEELAQQGPGPNGAVLPLEQLVHGVQGAARLARRYRFLMLDWVGIVRTVEPVRLHYPQHVAQRRLEVGALLARLAAEGYYRPPAPEQPVPPLVDALLILENFWVVYSEILADDRDDAQKINDFTQRYFALLSPGLTAKGTAALRQALAQLAPGGE